MADLDVAVRLRFLTAGDDKLKAAARDLQAFGKATGKLSSAATGRLSGDLTKAWTASVKLGGALDKSAGAASRTAAGLNRIGAEARDIDKARVAVDKLSKSTRTLGGAQVKVGRDALGRFGGTGARAAGGEGLIAAGAIGGAVSAKRRAALKAGALEAASRMTPDAYLLSAGGAVAAGALVGGASVAGIAATAVVTKKAIDEVIGREKAFVEVQKKVNLEAGQSWGQIDRQIAKVSTTLGKTYVDTAAVFDQFGSAGISGNELEGYAMLAGQQSSAWGQGMREAATGIAEVRAQTGKTLPQMEVFGDKINFLGDISAAAEKDIASMSQRALAAMKSAGVGEDPALALMTGLRSVGMQDEVAARYLGALTSTLRMGSLLQPAQQNALKSLGLDPKKVETNMQIDSMKTILDLMERLNKAKNPVAAAVHLMGQQWFDETLRMKEAAPEIKRVYEALLSGNYLGSMKKSMDLELSTTDAKINQLKASVSDLMATMAKPVTKGWLEPAVDAATSFVNRKRLALEQTEASKAAVKPKGLSIIEYERVHGFDRPTPSITRTLPMMAGVEGSTPHVNVKQVNLEMTEATAKANDLYGALQQLNMGVTPTVNVGGAMKSLSALRDEAAATAQTLRSLSNFGPPSLSKVRVNPTISGAPAGVGGSTGSVAPAAAPTTPGKQSRLGRGAIYANNIHFHGVKDLAGAHRQLAAMTDRRIRSARDGALHDIA